jgi:hypothetical protein
MTDTAVLGMIRNYLAQHVGDDVIIFGAPDHTMGQAKCFLELEEIWTHLKLGPDAVQARVKFKTTFTHHSGTLKEGSLLAERVKQLLEGQTFKLNDGRTAILRSLEGLSSYHHDQQEKTISQYYESLIRG